MRSLFFIYKRVSSVGCCYGSFSSIFSAESVLPKLVNLAWPSSCNLDILDLQHLLQRCAKEKLIMEGKSCHAQVIEAGLQTDTLISNILINMYSKCGLIDSARQVFDEMPLRNVVSWNTVIGAYMRHGEEKEALNLLRQMHREGTSPSEFTISSILCACAASSAICESKQLHAFAIKTAVDSNVYVGTALLDVYAKCSYIQDACLVFGSISDKTAVTWSSMVAGYVQNDLYEEALILFHSAQKMGLETTHFTLSAILSACASLSAMNEGTQVHGMLVKSGFDSNFFVATSLVDMYAKCGSIEEAYLIFSTMKEKNIVVLWNAMISGFAKHARSIEAMLLFEKMQQVGIHPNEVTYISVLSACSHAGLVNEGKHYFNLMIEDGNVESNVRHYSCMVDLLGRAGLIQEAWELMEGMPFDASISMWGSLLASCRIHGNLELAKLAAEHLFEMEPCNAGNHVLLLNLYAVNKRWDEVVKERKILKDSGVKKEMGRSWIETKERSILL